MKKYYILFVALAMPLFFQSCDDDDDTPVVVDEEKTIAELASESDDLTSLVKALERAGLVETFNSEGEYTVLAPTDAAFQALLDSNTDWTEIDDIPVETLDLVLKYHVIAAEVKSTDVTDGWATTLAMGPNDNGLSLWTQATGSIMFDDANVGTADIDASNGVIHTIDKVLMPMNLLERVVSNPNLSILETAVQAEGLQTDFLGALSGSDFLTVFAPVDDAFQSLLDDNPDFNDLSDIPNLENVLLYHVVSGNFQSSQLSDGMNIPTLLDGQGYVFNANETSLATTSQQNVTISTTDIQTTNGVIHIVDSVLLPL